MSDHHDEHDESDGDENDEEVVLRYTERLQVVAGDPAAAFRPGRLITDERGREYLDGRSGWPFEGEALFPEELVADIGQQLYAYHEVPNVTGMIDELATQNITGTGDVVYFANQCFGEECPPHPAIATALAANPWSANPWSANPWSANPWSANPWSANPWSANPWSANPWSANPKALNLLATGRPPVNTAMPAAEAAMPVRAQLAGGNLRIGVLDSGLAGGSDWDGVDRPPFLQHARITGDDDLPSVGMGSMGPDQYLDPVAGHGTFIAGLIEQLTPGCAIDVLKVFKPEGDVSDYELIFKFLQVMNPLPAIVNMSFGGPKIGPLLKTLIEHYSTKGVVFVASAGNEGSCAEQFPAALPDVVSVAALCPIGPAPWSNYGCWVDACAPGTDLVSSFFAEFNGAEPPVNGMDIDDFKDWATWTGTSFAAPIVVAALAREILTGGATAKQAVDRVIRSPHLARIPYMGTVVNY